MLRILCRYLGLLACVLPLSGCIFAKCCQMPQCDKGANLSADALRPVERSGAESSLQAVSVPLSVDEVDKQVKSVPHYRGISPLEAQCLAAGASSIGNLLDQERQAVSEHAAWCPKGKRLKELKESILLNAALEGRNQSAGAGLELFYRLAEAEARWELLQESIRILDDAIVKTKDLMKQGIKVNIDFEDLLRQRLGIQGEASQLHLAIERFNSDLRRTLGFEECAEEWRYWPSFDDQEPAAVVDMESAVHIGLEHRPQLKLLRSMPEGVDRRTLPAAQVLLKSFNGLLGMSEPQAQKPMLLLAFLGPADRIELEKSQRQMQQYLDERERTVAQDIRNAVRAVNTQIEVVALVRERVRIRKEKLDDLEAKAAKGITPFIEITLAKLEWLRVRDDAIKEVVSLKIAQAKLKQEQGLLGEECGCGNGCGPADAHPACTEMAASSAANEKDSSEEQDSSGEEPGPKPLPDGPLLGNPPEISPYLRDD